MSRVAGIEVKTALKKAGIWGTAVACGANNGILSLDHSIKRTATVEVDDSRGLYFPKDGTPGEVKVDGDWPMYLRYDGCDEAIALAMGVAGAPVQQGATSAYANTYKPKDNLDGLFATLIFYMKSYIEEHPSVKLAGFTLKGEIGPKPLQLIAKVISQNKVVDSAVNTLATFNNVTYRETQNGVRMAEGVFRMNDQDGAALDNTMKIYPSSFELTFMRKAAGVYSGAFRTTGTSPQDLIDEPTNNGLPEITLKLQFPQHVSAANILALFSDTRKKMDITFTGKLIADTYYRQHKLQFPHLQPKNADVQLEEGILKEPLEFNVLGAISAPAGMVGITDPFWWSVINQLSTDPLA